MHKSEINYLIGSFSCRILLADSSGKAPGVAHSQPGPLNMKNPSATSKLLSPPVLYCNVVWTHKLYTNPFLRKVTVLFCFILFFSVTLKTNWMMLLLIKPPPSTMFKPCFLLRAQQNQDLVWGNLHASRTVNGSLGWMQRGFQKAEAGNESNMRKFWTPWGNMYKARLTNNTLWKKGKTFLCVSKCYLLSLAF